MAKGDKTKTLEQVGIEAICERIAEGESQTDIARSFGVSKSYFTEWLQADDERSARAREARKQSGEYYAYKGERVLIDAEPNQVEIARARELASHYRWMAKTRDPETMGDKVAVGGASDLPPIQSTIDVSSLPTNVLAEIMKAKDAAK